MNQTLFIKNWHIDLNTYINAERTNRFAASKIKKDYTRIIAAEAINEKLKKMPSPVNVYIHWFMPNRKKDKDNISFGIKFILDGLVEAGILKNDGWNDIGTINHEFILTKEEFPYVIIDLEGGETK